MIDLCSAVIECEVCTPNHKSVFVIGVSQRFAHLTVNHCSIFVYLEVSTLNRKSVFVVAGSPYNDCSTHVPHSTASSQLNSFFKSFCSLSKMALSGNVERGILRVVAHGQLKQVNGLGSEV